MCCKEPGNLPAAGLRIVFFLINFEKKSFAYYNKHPGLPADSGQLAAHSFFLHYY
jgi:hypothetical protein